MDSPEHNEASLFEHCLDLPKEERKAFLERSCPNDPDIRDRIMELLRAHDESEGFMHSLPKGETEKVLSELHRIAPSEEKTGDQIGRYRLIELIGEGSWGTVWRAQQVEDIERQVALKILKLGLDTKEFLARFEAERQTLALMDHPNIAQVFDVGATEFGRPYFVMELVRGVPIFEYADRERLTIEQRVQLFIDVCLAVQHAHSKGVIHRDLKPSNIMVTVHDDKPVPKVIDFGIAKTTQVRLSEKTLFTAFNAFVGTPIYSSPEQLRGSGGEIDHRSDVYSLGALLYELLSGGAPFDPAEIEGKSFEALRELVLENDPQKPSLHFSSLSEAEKKDFSDQRKVAPTKVTTRLKGDLDWIVLKCLEKERTRRYDTVNELIQDLKAFLEDRPVSAAAPSLLYKTQKFLRRRRTGNLLLSATAAVLFVILIWVLAFSGNSSPGPIDPFADIDSQSIAVLPLTNMSPDPNNAFFADGVQEDILTNLSKVEDLLVISRSSTLQYRDPDRNLQQVGVELGVRYLVEGSVRRDDQQVRVAVQLIDAMEGGHVWAENYDRNLDDFFSIQADVAKEIAIQLQAVMSPEEIARIERQPTESVEAYDYYVRARQLIDFVGPRRMDEKVSLLEKAVELDPEFAEAWAQLVIERIFWWDFIQNRDNPQLLAQGHYALEKVKQTGPDLPHLHLAMHTVALREDRNLEASIEHLLQALAIEPNFQLAHLRLGMRYLELGRLAESQHHFESALRVDPRNQIANGHLNICYQIRDEWDKVSALLERNLETGYSDWYYWWWEFYLAEFRQTGNLGALIQQTRSTPDLKENAEVQLYLSLLERDFEGALKRFKNLDPDLSFHLSGENSFTGASLGIYPLDLVEALIRHEHGSPWRGPLEQAHEKLKRYIEVNPTPENHSNLAVVHAFKGNLAEMETAIERARALTQQTYWQYLHEGETELRIAVAYLLADDLDRAMETLEYTLTLDTPLFVQSEVKLWFLFDRLRGHPRFEALLK